MIVQGAHPSHYEWLVNRTKGSVTPDFKAIEAVDEAGRIHGMIGYSGWTETAVVMHIALDNPVAFRHLVQPAFWYPFIMSNRFISIAVVNSDNTRSMNLCRHVGYREVYRMKDGFKVGVDQILYEMRRDECRWIQPSWRRAA